VKGNLSVLDDFPLVYGIVVHGPSVLPKLAWRAEHVVANSLDAFVVARADEMQSKHSPSAMGNAAASGAMGDEQPVAVARGPHRCGRLQYFAASLRLTSERCVDATPSR
jgi:hypothetical protein